MQVKTQGLIIREQTVGESDRLVTVLTRDAGVVRAFARRAKNLKDSKSAATQLLCYSRLSIFKGREKYMIDDAEPIEVFFGLRRDIAALSLAQYFCELAYLMVPEDTDSEEYLRLILNSLHFLSKGTRPIRLLQSVTELRMLSSAGYMPNLVACENCAAYEAETMFFLPQRGIILCDKCFHGANEPYVALPPGVLTAMRHRRAAGDAGVGGVHRRTPHHARNAGLHAATERAPRCGADLSESRATAKRRTESCKARRTCAEARAAAPGKYPEAGCTDSAGKACCAESARKI